MTKRKRRNVCAVLAGCMLLAGCETSEAHENQSEPKIETISPNAASDQPKESLNEIDEVSIGNGKQLPEFYQGLSAVEFDDGKWGYIDTNGSHVIMPVLDEARNFNENGIAAVKLDGKWGYIDTNGFFLIEPQFDWVSDFDENGLAWVVEDGKDEIIDQTDFMVDARIETVRDLTSPWGLTVARGVGLWEGLWGYTGSIEIYEPLGMYDEARNFNENGIAAVKLDGKWGYIDTEGSFLIEPQFDWVSDFDENGLAWVKKDGERSIIDQNKDFTMGQKTDRLEGFDPKKLKPVRIGEKYIYTRVSSYAVPPFYKEVREFGENGMAAVMSEEGKWGYIGEDSLYYLIEDQFDDVRDFAKNGLAAVKMEGKWGYIDIDGNVVITPEFDEARDFDNNGLAAVKKDGKWGMINVDGDVKVKFQFKTEGLYNGEGYFFSEDSTGQFKNIEINYIKCWVDDGYVYTPWKSQGSFLTEYVWSSFFVDDLTRIYFSGIESSYSNEDDGLHYHQFYSYDIQKRKKTKKYKEQDMITYSYQDGETGYFYYNQSVLHD